jgi:diaminopimelate epimerase
MGAIKMKINFHKYQACGNDFIIIDTKFSKNIISKKRGKLAKFLCNRNFGIGADDVLYLDASFTTDIRLKIFESQGPEADMCGNGIRCVAAYLCEKLNKSDLIIETNDGIKHIKKIGSKYQVNMGKLRTKMKDMDKYFIFDFPGDELLLNKTINFSEVGKINVSIVNSSEPHCVIFVEDVDKEDINKFGKNICENKKLFPYGININLVEVNGRNILKIRTYERGVFHETLACGTGATASAAVAYILGKIKGNQIEVDVKGGKIEIEITEGALYMTGLALKVFEGVINIKI